MKTITKEVDGLLITYEGGVIKTPEELLEESEIDLDEWEIVSVDLRSWPTTMKADDGHAVQILNHYVWIKLKPTVLKMARDMSEEIIDMLKDYSPKYEKVERPEPDGEPVMAMLDLYDLHVGMLAWADETRAQSWDSKILFQTVMEAVERLLGHARAFNIEEIMLVVGNDLLHADTPANETTRGTRQDVDSRPQKMFMVAYELMTTIIDRIRQIAPVTVLTIPGNHDQTTAGYMGTVLHAHYRLDPEVEVDNAPSLRKHRVYGANFLGFTHGSEEKLAELPMIFMAESPQDWGNASFREIFTGHLHRKQKKRIPGITGSMPMADVSGTFNGVTVHVIPSLVPPEAWHASKGYTGGGRAAEIRFFHPEDGPIGEFRYNVRT